MFRYKFLKTLLTVVAILFSTSAVAQINTAQVLRIGQNALYFEDYMLSIQYFNQVITAKPYLAQPYFLRAIAKINLEDYSGAETDASKAIELNPFITDAWEVRGVARQNLGKDSAAINDYDHALNLLPRNRQLLFNKAMAQHSVKDYQGADTTFSMLLKWYPGYDNGYLGRARLRLAQADTVAALDDINHALEINRNAFNGYVMRADIAINRAKDYESALSDMNEAIKLQPKYAGLYINRAFLRYNQDDYFGAMADYDYALQLEPYNQIALFNRGLMLTEVNANDRALDDFTKVLELDPDDYRSLYNRALLYRAKGNTKAALADINRVIEAFPDFPGGYYIRCEINRDRNQLSAAERDYKKAMALAKAAKPVSKTDSDNASANASSGSEQSDDIPAELVSKRFATLLTIEDNTDMEEEYNNQAIRGKVQDRNINIEIEPMMQLSYYSSPSELHQDTYYIREVDELNAARMLRFVIVVTNAVPTIDEEAANRHFKSIEYYNSYLATHQPRLIDYIGRALDFITIRDYTSAEKDIERAIALSSDYALAYYLRAQSAYHRYELLKSGNSEDEGQKFDAMTAASIRHKLLDDILADYNRVTDLSPRMAPAWFNKGNVLVEAGDYTSAIAAYSKAIELKAEMGEAYYNRGYVYLKLGNQNAGIADLSKAGELGILPAYNLIKRISR
jgi:tetratricopeptide (TPR) repeat protein